MDIKDNHPKIVPFTHPDPWRNAYVQAGEDSERLRLLCRLLLGEREWHVLHWIREGFPPPAKYSPPDWQ
jgi:hypothetical protein